MMKPFPESIKKSALFIVEPFEEISFEDEIGSFIADFIIPITYWHICSTISFRAHNIYDSALPYGGSIKNY